MHGWSTDNSSSALEEKVEAIKRTVLANFIYFLGMHASYACTIIQFCSHWPLPQDSCTQINHYSDLLALQTQPTQAQILQDQNFIQQSLKQRMLKTRGGRTHNNHSNKVDAFPVNTKSKSDC